LDALSDLVAQTLLARNPKPGNRVCMMSGHTVAAIIGVVGTLKAGQCLIPFNSHENDDFLKLLWNSSVADLILADPFNTERAKQICCNAERVVCLDELADSSEFPAKMPNAQSEETEIQAIIYTSGSTAHPKGVMTTPECVLERAGQYIDISGIGPGCSQAAITPWHFAASIPEIFGSLLSGAHLCLYDAHEHGVDGLAEWIKERRINLLQLPVALSRRFLGQTNRISIPSVRFASISGDRLYRKEALSLLALMDPKALLVHTYGSTETNLIAQIGFQRSTDDWPKDTAAGALPAGFPVPGKTLHFLDEHGEPVPPGESGQIAVESNLLSPGYWNQLKQTEESFRIGAAGQRLYLTGDIGKIRSDGCLEVSGRMGTHVKVRGMRVVLTAVESALLSLPEVANAVVTAHETSGQDSSLFAHVEARESASLDTSQLRHALLREIPAHWIPSRFVFMEAMPLMDSGKIDRQKLPDPGTSRPRLAVAYLAPKNADEKLVADVWGELLNVEAIGAHDEFYDLGGDSLCLIEVLHQIELRTHVDLKLKDLDAVPTPARMAAALALRRDLENSRSGTRPSETTSGRRAEVHSRENFRHPRLSHRLKRLVKDPMRYLGPMLFGKPLPYASGVRLHRWFAQHARSFPRPKRFLSHIRVWHERLGIKSELEESFQRSLMANTWVHWRVRSLEDRLAFNRWVELRGEDHLAAALALNQGVILVTTHVWFNALLQNIPCIAKQRVSQIRQFKGDQFGDGADGIATHRATQLQEAIEVLRMGGIALTAGDGRHGQAEVEMTVHGTIRRFQPGAAVLAETTGAAMLPVFGTIRANGTILFRFLEPLVSKAETREKRITDLTRQYGEQFSSQWPEIYDSLAWKSMSRALDPPKNW
jgi:acyl-coenzyme A synthetase/AMP-(fatty) acid ligase/acyl carrier protein